MKLKLFLALVFVVLVAGGVVAVKYYEYVFAKTVQGEIVGVDRVTQTAAVIGGDTKPSDLYSFAVAVRGFEDHKIYTSSTEDRRWGVVQKGQCAEVRFFPYPPWDLQKRGTYFGARIIEIFDCPKK